MTVAFRADAETTNSVASTSVVMSKPANTADGDVLVAYISELGTGSITAPAGWTLIGSQAAGTSLTTAAYYKVASGEGASWTWTLGASVVACGWVGAFTGVDTTSPVAGSASASGTTSVECGDVEFRPNGMLVQAGAASATATGAAPTLFSTRKLGDINTSAPAAAYVDIRAELATNLGAGTDVATTVATYPATWNVRRSGADWGDKWQCEVTTTARIGWNVSLEPAIVATFGGGDPSATVEAALGGDPDDDTTWVWTDISSDVRHQEAVTIRSGRTSEGSAAEPTGIELALNSLTGTWHPDNAFSSRFPDVRRGMPLRVTVPYGRASTSLRGIAFAHSFQPAWDLSTNWAIVRVGAVGRLARLRRGQPLRSALSRLMSGTTATGVTPHEYWPMTDGSGTTRFASALPGGPPMQVVGSVTYASEQHPASSPLPVFASGTYAKGPVRAYTDVGQWVVPFQMKVPSEPSSETTFVEIKTSGTGATMRVTVAPGTPSTVYLRVYNSDGTLLDSVANTLDGSDTGHPSEADFYGQWVTCFVASITDVSGFVPWLGVSVGSSFESAAGTSPISGSHGAIRSAQPMAGNGASFGHVGVYTSASYVFDTTDGDVSDVAAAALGWAGEYHPDRFIRINREEDVAAAMGALSPVDYTADAMGAQGEQTISGTYTDIEGVNAGGFIHDSRGPSGEVILDYRPDRYNAPVAMTIDMDASQLHPPYAPLLDDQRMRTHSTVTRTDGSSATYANDVGEGDYSDAVTVNLSDDGQPLDWASWRVALGTEGGLRYPQIAIDLRRSTDLVADFCDLRIGDRIRLTGKPSQQSTEAVDLIVEGITETISNTQWSAVLHCSPAKPYDIGVYGTHDNEQGRVTSGNSTLAADVTSSATTLIVDPGGDTWATTATFPAEFPFDVRVGGVNGLVYACSAITGSIGDDFSDTASNGWASADAGGAWTTSGGAASDYSKSGGVGRHSCSTTATFRASTIDAGSADQDLTVDVMVPLGSPTGNSVGHWICLRETDGNNHYIVKLAISTGGVVQISLSKRVGGALSGLGSAVTVDTGHVSGTWYSVHAQVSGSTLRAKAWLASSAEPKAWDVETTDTDLTSGTLIGLRSRLESGNTDGTVLMQWDDLTMAAPYRFTVTRLATDRAWSAGTEIDVDDAARYGL